jgi:hypothetical protein
MYPVLSCEQNKAMDGWLIYSRIINEFEIALSVSPCNKVLQFSISLHEHFVKNFSRHYFQANIPTSLTRSATNPT